MGTSDGLTTSYRFVRRIGTEKRSAVSDAPDSKLGGRFLKSCGARPLQLFEGSRPWVGIYANSKLLGL